MAFNTSMTSQSQTNPTDNINTRGIQFYNGDATIVFDYWNGMASIKIHPALPEAERANKQVYDYKKSVSVALSPDNAVLVGKYIKEDILPAIEKGEECTRAVVSARVNLFVVSTGVNQYGEVKPFIGIYRKLDENRIPAESMVFHFDKHPVITKYAPTTGEIDMNSKYTELVGVGEFFTACSALMNAGVHADNFSNRFRINREYEFRAAASGKLGIDNGSGNRTNFVNRSNGGASQNIWDIKTPTDNLSNDNGGGSLAETSTASFDALSDLM